MRAFYWTPLALAVALTSCTGGTGGFPAAPISAPFVPNSATIALSIILPGSLVPTSKTRAPLYVSQGMRSIAVYDGSTVIYVGNFNPASNPQFTTVFAKSGTTSASPLICVLANGGNSATCTTTITTSIGAHSFDIITYPNPQGQQTGSRGRATLDTGTVPTTFSGVILSEGELSVTLVQGSNPGQTVTPLGVADHAVFTGPVLTQRLNGNGAFVGIIGTTYTIQYVINDSANAQIVLPGNYDNAPVTIAETDAGNIVQMTAVSQSTPPAGAGQQSFNVTCQNNGTATFTAASANKPNATYASGLTYSASNYSPGVIGTTTLQCVPNSATLPVTVN